MCEGQMHNTWYLGKAVTGGSVLLFRTEVNSNEFDSKQMIEVCEYYDLSSMLIVASTGKKLSFNPFKNDTTTSFIDFSYIENANGPEKIGAIRGIVSIRTDDKNKAEKSGKKGDDNKSISKGDKYNLVTFLEKYKDAIMRIERL